MAALNVKIAGLLIGVKLIPDDSANERDNILAESTVSFIDHPVLVGLTRN